MQRRDRQLQHIGAFIRLESIHGVAVGVAGEGFQLFVQLGDEAPMPADLAAVFGEIGQAVLGIARQRIDQTLQSVG